MSLGEARVPWSLALYRSRSSTQRDNFNFIYHHCSTSTSYTFKTGTQPHRLRHTNFEHHLHFIHVAYRNKPTPNMPNQIIEDVKTGIKGIRGAGDAIRGSAMGAVDQTLDNGDHPTTQASELKNQSITEKGKQDINAVDDMVARREQEHRGKKAIETEARAGNLH
ncbi:hypothetical protein F5Y18DRAFT_256285 [Xylariaceae sp. FL1019]|nr:hypothetical protein F5Y18DRAFT_256285 [Xylariaceae sp. FL1019]